MQATKQAHTRRLVKPLVTALAAVASCAAWADEPTPFYIGGKQTFSRDSNVYRTQDGRHDYISSTSLLGGFDQQVSRQRFYATADVAYNKFHNATTLDNTSYGVKAGWDWATIENLSGTLFVSADQELANYGGNNNVVTTQRNLLKTDQIGASAKLGGEGILTLEGTYAHSRVRYSLIESLSSQSSADTASIGGFYRVGGALKLGIAYRATRTENPYAVLKPGVVNNPPGPEDYDSNTVDGKNVDLLANWTYSEQTKLGARISYTKQSNSFPGIDDFSGATGALSASYAPTDKLLFDVEFARDAGTNGVYFNNVNNGATGTPFGLTQGSQTANVATIGVKYAATAKITAKAGYRYRNAKIRNFNGTGLVADQTDDLKIATFGLTYDITRAIQLGCDLARETRDVTGAPAFAYNATVFGCSARILLK